MTARLFAQWAVRIAGLVAVLLGLLVWVGGADGIVPLHMLVGLVLVAGLWTLAALGLMAGTGPALPAVAVVWGVLTVLFGLNQETILPGDQHVGVEVAHLLVGLVAIGIGEALGARIARTRRGTTA
jgi:hypothetical protein